MNAQVLELDYDLNDIDANSLPSVYLYVSMAEHDHVLYAFEGSCLITDIEPLMDNIIKRHSGKFTIQSMPKYCGICINEDGVSTHINTGILMEN